MENADRKLIEWVQRQINRGDTRIRLPANLLSGASEEALEQVRQLCRLNGVEVVEM